MTEPGILLVLSGPSGVGKTTIADRLIDRAACVKITTCTTRAPRGKEVDGKDYHFFTRENFEKKIADGGFLEHAEIHDQYYGTPKQAIQEALAAGRVVILPIDVQGARAVRETGMPALLIFLAPPDEEELLRRIRGRGTETEEAVQRRLKTAEWEMKQKDSFDTVVVNDDLDRAVDEIVEELKKRGQNV